MAFNGEIYEIMSWLPVKPLYKLVTMAKSSLEYISEPLFQEKQCYNSSMREEESLIIQEDSSLRERVQKLQFCFLPDNRSYIGIPKDSIEFLSEKGRILGSCNGLVLCRTISSSNEPTELFLCNPSTRTWLPIKLPDEELAKRVQSNGSLKVALVCGNVVYSSSKKFPLDYTIILFNENDLEEWNFGYDVYVYEEGKWSLIDENIKTGGGTLCFDNHVCCKDGLYVLSEACLPVILHYDIKNQKSRVIALPENFQKLDNNSFYFGCFRVFGWERKKGQSWFESICLVKCSGDRFITIWVLQNNTKSTSSKVEKNSSSWNWVSSLHIEDELGIVHSRWTQSFTILDKHLIYADCDGNIYRYSLEDKNYNKIYEYGQCPSLKIRFNSFSTTLRPCSNEGQQPF